jgi:Sulfatase/Stf0 sulphotransferase
MSRPSLPNVLYLHSHDTGRYVQPYGHPVPTPNIQRLADQGVLFRRAFCAAPTCSASRACLLTGQYGLRRQEDAWRGFFFRIGQRPLSLYYEDIAGDLEGTVGRVLDELRIARAKDGLLARQPLSRQSDELSESWVQSYLEDVSRR